ncbi:WYL domain-containing protein, partial [Streptomyces venezuelae]
EGVASRVYARQARFLVHAPASVVRGQVPPSAALVRPLGDDRCELVTGAADLDFLIMRVLLLGHPFEALDPPDLASHCHALAQRLLSVTVTTPPSGAAAQGPTAVRPDPEG